MKSIITSTELSEFVDLLMNSKLGQRITQEQQAKYQPDSNGEYSEVYWDKMNERHVEALNCVIEHLNDPTKQTIDRLS